MSKLAIEKACLTGRSKLKIAQAYGVSYASLLNHSEHHLSRQLLQSARSRELLDTNSLLDEVSDMIARIKAIEDKACDGGQLVVQLKSIEQLRQSFEFLIRLGLSLQRALEEDRRTEDRLEIDRLKTNLTRFELETLQTLLAKANGVDDSSGELLSAKWSGKSLTYYDLRERPHLNVAPADAADVEESPPSQQPPRKYSPIQF